jgi:hypothetical protein
MRNIEDELERGWIQCAIRTTEMEIAGQWRRVDGRMRPPTNE